MIMKSRWHIIVACSLVAVGPDGSLTWAGQGETLLLFAQQLMGRSGVQAASRIQSEDTPIAFILRHKGELNLSGGQLEEIETINGRLEELIRSLRQKVQKAIDELAELLKADRIDIAAAEEKIREYAALEVELSIGKLRAVESAKAVLRPDQLAKLKALPVDDGERSIVRPGLQRGI